MIHTNKRQPLNNKNFLYMFSMQFKNLLFTKIAYKLCLLSNQILVALYNYYFLYNIPENTYLGDDGCWYFIFRKNVLIIIGHHRITIIGYRLFRTACQLQK